MAARGAFRQGIPAAKAVVYDPCVPSAAQGTRKEFRCT